MPETKQTSEATTEFDSETLMECLAGALETMAFIGVYPAEASPLPPADSRLVTISFSGSYRGSLELVVDRALGCQLAANALGVDPGDPAALERAGDAIGELANIICGSLLSRMDGGDFEMGIPSVAQFDAAAEWDRFIASPSACVVDAEGTPVALRAVILA